MSNDDARPIALDIKSSLADLSRRLQEQAHDLARMAERTTAGTIAALELAARTLPALEGSTADLVERAAALVVLPIDNGDRRGDGDAGCLFERLELRLEGQRGSEYHGASLARPLPSGRLVAIVAILREPPPAPAAKKGSR